jgi:hypothetical protein
VKLVIDMSLSPGWVDGLARHGSVIQLRMQDLLSERAVESVVTAVRVHAEALSRGAPLSIDETGTRARILPLTPPLINCSFQLLWALTRRTVRARVARGVGQPTPLVDRPRAALLVRGATPAGDRADERERMRQARFARERDAFGAPRNTVLYRSWAAQPFRAVRKEGRLSCARECDCAADARDGDARVGPSLSASRPLGGLRVRTRARLFRARGCASGATRCRVTSRGTWRS